MCLFPIKITLLQYLTTIKSDATIYADKSFTNYKFFLLTRKLHKMPLHFCSEAWNSATHPAEKHQAKVALFRIYNTMKVKSDFRKVFHFHWPLITLILKDTISSSVMPAGKSKVLKNSLKVQKALLLPTAFEEWLRSPWFIHICCQ